MQHKSISESSVTAKGHELTKRKLRDFLAKVDEAQRCFLQQGLGYNTATICKMVAAQHAPRFYIDTSEALKQYRFYLQGKSNIHSDTRRRMYAEVFARYEHLVNIAKASGQSVYKKELMRRVLEQEAPSFYYEEGSAVKMYYRVMRRKRYRKL